MENHLTDADLIRMSNFNKALKRHEAEMKKYDPDEELANPDEPCDPGIKYHQEKGINLLWCLNHERWHLTCLMFGMEQR